MSANVTGPATPDSPINTWDQVGHGGIYISKAYSGIRSRAFYGWQVCRRGYSTDPNAPWYNHGNKTFSAFGDGDRGVSALARAKEWAREHYGIENWKRNSMGDYVDADKGYPPLRKRVKGTRSK